MANHIVGGIAAAVKAADRLDAPSGQVADADAWPDLKVSVGASLPRIAPQVYTARSVELRTFYAYRRRCVAILFDIYAEPLEAGIILARLPLYCRLPSDGKRFSPSSKLVRIFDLLGPRPRRLDRLPMNDLRNRLWRVEVGDVEVGGDHDRDGRHRSLHETQRYSVIRTVLERLA